MLHALLPNTVYNVPLPSNCLIRGRGEVRSISLRGWRCAFYRSQRNFAVIVTIFWESCRYRVWIPVLCYCLTRFLSLKVLCQLAPNLVKSTTKYRCHLHCTGVHLSIMAAAALCTIHRHLPLKMWRLEMLLVTPSRSQFDWFLTSNNWLAAYTGRMHRLRGVGVHKGWQPVSMD